MSSSSQNCGKRAWVDCIGSGVTIGDEPGIDLQIMMCHRLLLHAAQVYLSRGHQRWINCMRNRVTLMLK